MIFSSVQSKVIIMTLYMLIQDHTVYTVCMYLVFLIAITLILSLGQGDEYCPLKCCRCNSILGSIAMEDICLDALDVNCSDGFSIHLYKHTISLRSSSLFRYGLCY